MSLLEVLIDYCVAKGVLIGDGEDSFRNFMPEAPDVITVFFEYSSDAPLPQYTEHVHRSVQIVTRAKTDEDAKEQAFRLYGVFVAETESLRIDFSSSDWGQVYIRQLPFKIGQDESERVTYAFNLGITTNIIE